MTDGAAHRRRHRRPPAPVAPARDKTAPDTAAPDTAVAGVAASESTPDAPQRPATDRPADPPTRRRPRESGERGLRDLVGGGRSQLGVSGALRARDVNRPTADDLAEAERDTVIVRRNWRPDS